MSCPSDGYADTARRVIAAEIAALHALAGSIGDSFAQAAEVMLACKGRVIVSGMGKSGHIGRKIAATLASTGTPAYFVHPAEASHGDLGMITAGDVVLALSHSGETPELADLIAHTQRFDITLIAMTRQGESTLIRQADMSLLLPAVAEACGKGIVPTASTTMMLALGDALAVALMTHRGFGPAHFRHFHPGGQLGARLSTVGDLMHKEGLPLVALDTPMPEALLEMSRKGFGVVGILDSSGALCGIITDGDLRRHMEGLLEQRVQDVMTPSPLTIAASALAEEAVALMTSRKITCLFVVADQGALAPTTSARRHAPNAHACPPLGLLHIHDCLRIGLGPARPASSP